MTEEEITSTTSDRADEEYLSVREVAMRLHVSTQTILGWISSGQLRALRTPTGRLRIRKSDVARLLTPA
jgi:excisionase family DNA binding protein